MIVAEVAKHRAPVAAEAIGEKLNISNEHVLETLRNEQLSEVVLLFADKGGYLVTQQRYEQIRKGIERACADYHKNNPLSERGINLNEIRGALKMERTPAVAEALGKIIENLIAEKKLRELNKTWLPASASGKLSEASQRNVKVVEDYFENCGMTTPINPPPR